jgi:hypothetical protein
VESDSASISAKISASRSGGLGGVFICVRDAAELKFCLLLPGFFAEESWNQNYSRAPDHSALHARKEELSRARLE